MIKGVPALPPNWFFWDILGSPGRSKNLEKTMLKWTSKNGGTEPENQGPEPQSARAGAVETHFRIFWKNSKYQRKCIHFRSLFRFFFAPFSRLRRKPKKGSRVRPLAHKNTSKWSSRAPKRSPRINNLRPKVPPSTNSHGRVLAEGDVDPPRCLAPLAGVLGPVPLNSSTNVS